MQALVGKEKKQQEARGKVECKHWMNELLQRAWPEAGQGWAGDQLAVDLQ